MHAAWRARRRVLSRRAPRKLGSNHARIEAETVTAAAAQESQRRADDRADPAG